MESTDLSASIVMPRGAYRGFAIEEIPSDYLLYVAENWSESTPEDKAICAAADKEWHERERDGEHFYREG